MNTLFVDKNLRYHGLLQAYSRTNRIFDATKTFGNIVTFRNLEQATIDAITLFGDKNTEERGAAQRIYEASPILSLVRRDGALWLWSGVGGTLSPADGH